MKFKIVFLLLMTIQLVASNGKSSTSSRDASVQTEIRERPTLPIKPVRVISDNYTDKELHCMTERQRIEVWRKRTDTLKQFGQDVEEYRIKCQRYGYRLFLYLAQQSESIDGSCKNPNDYLTPDDLILLKQIRALLIDETT